MILHVLNAISKLSYLQIWLFIVNHNYINVFILFNCSHRFELFNNFTQFLLVATTYHAMVLMNSTKSCLHLNNPFQFLLPILFMMISHFEDLLFNLLIEFISILNGLIYKIFCYSFVNSIEISWFFSKELHALLDLAVLC